MRSWYLPGVILIGLSSFAGCGGTETDPSSAAPSAASPTHSSPSADANDETPSSSESASTTAPPRRGPVSLGTNDSNGSSAAADATAVSESLSTENIMQALKPLQILMGSWEGKTRRMIGGFSAVDEPKWVWDLLTDKKRPALVMTSDKSPYFNRLRLSFDTSTGKFQLTSEHKDEGTREFVGEFVAPVEDVSVDDDTKPQRTFQLQFTQTAPADAKELWRITFNQQRNDRYLVQLERKRGSSDFFQFDVVASQRQGTSFALSDTDYGERTCIVSGGLGTSTVSFMGKTYYVCCSGCDAAFKEDPQRWIAKVLADAEKK